MSGADSAGGVEPPERVRASLAHLFGRLEILESRVRAAVARRRAGDPDVDDRFRGLYISEAQVDGLLSSGSAQLLPEVPDAATAAELAAIEAEADAAEGAGKDLRLRRLARSFGLDPYDIELLIIALAPDLDPRFERLYGYLHDDISRRRASTGLALELCGAPHGSAEGRARLGPFSPLVAGGLVLVEEPDRPFLTRSLRVPDRVAAHLLGDDTPDPAVEALLGESIGADLPDVRLVERALGQGIRLCYLRERPGASGQSLATAAFERVGLPVIALDLHRLGTGDDVRDIAAGAIREATLRGAGLVVGPIEPLAERGAAAVRAFAESRRPIVLTGVRAWDPAWSREAPLVLAVSVPDIPTRQAMWRSALNGSAPADLDPAEATLTFRLAPEQVQRAARSARMHAAAEGRPLTAADVRAGARAQNAAGLERLARRIEPSSRWGDLVLPPIVETQLRELSARARLRDRVIDEWGVGRKASKGIGIAALFAGDSGTGKTMSAEVLAGDLGFDLYVIDLSTVVDKYIGETEKNLDRIFSEADRVNGVLLFDEADAIFGKRSEVKDARDRYANVEVAYLLQRMELFDGLAILTTNLRANVDDAFTRRLDAIIDFPMPEDEARRQLWERNLRPDLPKTDDLDLDFLARRFKLSGGNIRNIVVAAAFFAAADERALSMADLIRATEREYRKLGRLTSESEFGKYHAILMA